MSYFTDLVSRIELIYDVVRGRHCSVREYDSHRLLRSVEIQWHKSEYHSIPLKKIMGRGPFYLALLRKHGTWDGDTISIHCFRYPGKVCSAPHSLKIIEHSRNR